MSSCSRGRLDPTSDVYKIFYKKFFGPISRSAGERMEGVFEVLPDITRSIIIVSTSAIILGSVL